RVDAMKRVSRRDVLRSSIACSLGLGGFPRADRVSVRPKDLRPTPSVRALARLLEKTPAGETSPTAAMDEIFSLLPSRVRKDVDGRMSSILPSTPYRGQQDLAVKKSLNLLQDPETQSVFQDVARRYMVRKASQNVHHLKFLAAVFEDVNYVSPEWRPRFLSATVNYLQGPASPDFAPIAAARKQLGS
ncbi:MAG: hypothetical protein AAF517_27545, partial [Planctomycetota bacterium]